MNESMYFLLKLGDFPGSHEEVFRGVFLWGYSTVATLVIIRLRTLGPLWCFYHLGWHRHRTKKSQGEKFVELFFWKPSNVAGDVLPSKFPVKTDFIRTSEGNFPQRDV